MSGAGLIELLAARLAGRGARSAAAPTLREAIATMPTRIAGEPNPIMLRISDLPERGVDQAKVRQYGDMLSTSEPPPILVARRPGGSWEIMDGEHRAAAMRQAGRQEVPAIDISERVGWGAQEAPPTAPSLRNALAEVNANRARPDAGGGQGGNGAAFDENTTWYRGGRPGSGRTFLTRDRAMAERFARDLHGTDEVAAGNVASGRQMVVDWAGRPWDAGPSGWSTDHMAKVARREGYDSVLLQNVESVRGSPADELVLLNENQFRPQPDGGSVRGENSYREGLRAEGFDTEAPLFHGTTREFDDFDLNAPQSDGVDLYGRGVYLTSDADFAGRSFASEFSGGQPNIRPVFARLQNPLVITPRSARETRTMIAPDVAAQIVRDAGGSETVAQAIATSQKPIDAYTFWHFSLQDTPTRARSAALQRAGFDGIVADPNAEMGASGSRPHVVVFDPENVRPQHGSTRAQPNAGNALQRALRDRMGE